MATTLTRADLAAQGIEIVRYGSSRDAYQRVNAWSWYATLDGVMLPGMHDRKADAVAEALAALMARQDDGDPFGAHDPKPAGPAPARSTPAPRGWWDLPMAGWAWSQDGTDTSS